jgi:hypothetical protein
MNTIAATDEVSWGAAWDWGGHGTGLGAAEDGRGGKAESVRAGGAPHLQLADCAVETAAVDEWLGGNGCHERE